ncbi:bifunctional 4-hydroxy-2-oxoglutarate aldolase/2-dehydro-3-deoxy-phosphogluconate aldolase [Chitinophagaceae bacterium MMS25-I14]
MNNGKAATLELLHRERFMPLYYHDSAEVSKNVLKALYDGGVRLVEYTNRGKHAADNFDILRHYTSKELPGLQLGVGTIKTVEAAKIFMDRGADFVVCPIVSPQVAQVVHERNLLWIPGCFTNTEIFTAETAGASLVKIFPGSLAGPGYISAVKEIFPYLDFMPTGGVDTSRDNLEAWFSAGVAAVGMGSKLVTKEIMESGQYEKLTEITRQTIETIRACQ